MAQIALPINKLKRKAKIADDEEDNDDDKEVD